MANTIKNLIIKINFEGEVIGELIPYKYTKNTLNKSRILDKVSNEIFIPTTTLINRKELAKSKYNKDYYKLFQSKENLLEFIKNQKNVKSKDTNREIENKNIKTIKDAFFPDYSTIYLHDKVFTIISVNFKNNDVETIKNILSTKEQLEDELIQKLEKREIDNLKKQKLRFQKQYDKMKDEVEKKKLKDSTPILDLTDLQIEDRARTKALKLLYGTGIDTENMIKDYANKKILDIDNNKNKYFGLKYKYDNSKGIVLAEKKNIIIATFSMNLKKFEEKDKTLQKFKLLQNRNCKTRKENIINIYNTLFKRKRELTKKLKSGKSVYKYDSNKIQLVKLKADSQNNN